MFDSSQRGLQAIQWWLYWKLPTLWWWGVKVKILTEDRCAISMRYSWFNQNPFRSAYFAALCGAGELSTGLLVQQKTRELDMSMLLVSIEARFVKKATGIITFTCTEGQRIAEYVLAAKQTSEGITFDAISTGINKEGAVVAELKITWSLRQRRKLV